jgi:GTP-binding protein
MKISSVVFSRSLSIESEKIFFDEKSQVVFIGRSNVGKSSLMNKIFASKDLVKTSSMPGKTKLANLFLVNNKFYFTDLP